MALDLSNLPSRLDGASASEYLKLLHGIKRSPQTLAKYRSLGGGPKFRRAGHQITYELEHLDEYAGQLLGDVVQAHQNTKPHRTRQREVGRRGVRVL